MTAFIRYEEAKQVANQPVLGQEVMESYGLVVQGIGPRLGPARHKALCALGGHWAVAGQSNQLQEWVLYRQQPPLSSSLQSPECCAAAGDCLCSALAAFTSIPSGQQAINPASHHLPFLVPAEEEPAKAKLLRLCAGACLWWLRCRSGQAMPACRGGEMSHSFGIP